MKVKMKVNYMGSKYEKWSGAVSGTGSFSLLKFGQLHSPSVALPCWSCLSGAPAQEKQREMENICGEHTEQ